ncbi:MAG: acyl carrier protein [Bacillota bacterium]
MSTFEKVKEMLVTQLKIEEEKITMDTDFVQDLQADSIDVFEMLVAMEEEFDVTLPDEEVQNMKKVSDLVAFLEGAIG